MAIGPSNHSDEEILKRLQIVVKDIPAGSSDLVRFDGDMRELRNLTSELATRIYEDPERWGVASVPAEVRDDTAADTLVALLGSVSTFRARQPVAEWFATQAEQRARELSAVQQQKPPAPARPAAGKRSKPAPEQDLSVSPPVFEGALWQGFEEDSPRDAFALRLRYLLNRTPEDMAEMLEAPSARAVSMRLNRARDRFRMYCEQHGADVRATEALLVELGEVRKR